MTEAVQGLSPTDHSSSYYLILADTGALTYKRACRPKDYVNKYWRHNTVI